MLNQDERPVTWAHEEVAQPKLDTFIDRFLEKGLITRRQAHLALAWREDFMMAGLLRLGSSCRHLARIDRTMFGYDQDHWKRRKAYQRWQRKSLIFKRRQDRSDLVDLCCLDLIPETFHRMHSIKNRLHYLFSLFENEHFKS